MMNKADKEMLDTGMQIDKAIMIPLYEGPEIVEHKGRVGLTWYDINRELKFRFLDSDKVLSVSSGSPEPSLDSWNIVKSDGENIYFLWRPKMAQGSGDLIGEKYVYFRASYDDGQTLSQPVRLNQEGGAINPSMSIGTDGKIAVVWEDEREGQYDIYINVSADSGKTWAGETRLSEGKPGKTSDVSSRVFVDGSDMYVSWVTPGVMKDEAILMLKASHDGGQTWDAAAAINKSTDFNDPKIFRVGDRVLILWCGRSADGYTFTTDGIYSGDAGQTWADIGKSDVDSYIYFQTVVAHSNDRVYWAIDSRDAFVSGIDNIYFTSSSDLGDTWTSYTRLQENTPHHTNSVLPDIAIDDNGTVVVVWQDYRNIRGNIYASYSKDFGKTWSEMDIRLSAINRNAMYPKVVSDGNGKFYTVWLEFANDSLTAGSIVVGEVPVK